MIHDKPSIIHALGEVSREVSADLAAMTAEQFERSAPPEWSASGYLKHLLLSLKPFVRGLGVPKLVMAGMFGTSKQPPLTYQALTETYQRRISEGVRAEDFSDVTPRCVSDARRPRRRQSLPERAVGQGQRRAGGRAGGMDGRPARPAPAAAPGHRCDQRAVDVVLYRLSQPLARPRHPSGRALKDLGKASRFFV